MEKQMITMTLAYHQACIRIADVTIHVMYFGAGWQWMTNRRFSANAVQMNCASVFVGMPNG